MDVRSTGSLPTPVLALGIFWLSGEVALPPLGPNLQRTSSGIPHTDRPTSGLLSGNQVSKPPWKDKRRT